MTEVITNSEEVGPQKMVHLNPKINTESQKFKSQQMGFRLKQSADLKYKIENQKSQELLVREYQKFKYLDAIYENNDKIFIKNSQRHDDFIAKIKKIILIVSSNNKLEGVLLVQWYYRKNDLPDTFQAKEFDFISESEVFETNVEEYIPIECANGDCEILTYDEYDKLPNIKDNSIFFQRAWFDIEKKEIYNPPVSEWEKSCLCNQPLNPDLEYVQCEKCEEWYHIKCVKLSKEALKSKSFFCHKCK